MGECVCHNPRPGSMRPSILYHGDEAAVPTRTTSETPTTACSSPFSAALSRTAATRPRDGQPSGIQQRRMRIVAAVAAVLAAVGSGGCSGNTEAPQAVSASVSGSATGDDGPSCWPFVGVQENAEGPLAGHVGMLESDLDEVEEAARGFVQAVEVGDLEEAWWQYDEFEWSWSIYLETAANAEAACAAHPETVAGISEIVDDLHTEMVVPLREGCHAISATGWSSDGAGAHEFDHCRSADTEVSTG